MQPSVDLPCRSIPLRSVLCHDHARLTLEFRLSRARHVGELSREGGEGRKSRDLASGCRADGFGWQLSSCRCCRYLSVPAVRRAALSGYDDACCCFVGCQQTKLGVESRNPLRADRSPRGGVWLLGRMWRSVECCHLSISTSSPARRRRHCRCCCRLTCQYQACYPPHTTQWPHATARQSSTRRSAASRRAPRCRPKSGTAQSSPSSLVVLGPARARASLGGWPGISPRISIIPRSSCRSWRSVSTARCGAASGVVAGRRCELRAARDRCRVVALPYLRSSRSPRGTCPTPPLPKSASLTLGNSGQAQNALRRPPDRDQRAHLHHPAGHCVAQHADCRPAGVRARQQADRGVRQAGGGAQLERCHDVAEPSGKHGHGVQGRARAPHAEHEGEQGSHRAVHALGQQCCRAAASEG